MYTIDGIAYAEGKQELIEVTAVRALPDYMLWFKFTNGEVKKFDFRPHLDKPVYLPLKDEEVFRSVYVDSGIPMWCEGDIDIAPERLYQDGIPIIIANASPLSLLSA